MRRGQGAILLTVFLDLLGFGMVIPLLPLYAQEFHASGLATGLIAASFSAMQFLFNPLWGRLSDRVGRRPVLLASLAGSVVSMTLLGAANALWMLFAARLLAGIAGANIATAQAYMADITAPEERARAMGRIGAALGLGFVLGPVFGGLLSRWGAGLPGYVAAALSLGALGWTLVGLPESLAMENRTAPRKVFDREQWRRALGRAPTSLPILLFFVVTFGFTGLEMAFSLYAKERLHFDRMEIGIVFACIGVVIAATQGVFLGPLQRRFGERRLAFTGVFLLAVGIATLPICARDPLLRAVNIVVVAFGTAINTPSLTSLVSRAAMADEQGGILGVYQSLAALARATGPFWAGFVYDHVDHTAPFYSGAAIIALGWIFLAFPLLRLAPEAPATAK